MISQFLLLPTFRSQAAIVFEIYIVFTFSHAQAYAYASKTDIAFNLVKVIPVPSYEQITMGCSPTYYIPSFVKIGPSVWRRRIFEHGSHVEHSTQISGIKFFHPKMMGWGLQYYIPSFMEIGQPVLEKIFESFLPYRSVVAILAM